VKILTWQNPGPLGSAACQSGNILLLRYFKSLIDNSVAELRYIKKLEIWYKKNDHPTNIEVYRVSPNYRK